MEFLKQVLGEELYAQVAEKLEGNKEIKLINLNDGEFVSKHKLNDKLDELKEAQELIAQKDQQIADLSKVNPEELQEKIESLITTNAETAAAYEQKIEKMKFDNALTAAVAAKKAKNPKAVIALLSEDKLKLDGETVIGVDEQLEALRQNESYLFADLDPVAGAPNKGAPKDTPTDLKTLTSEERIALRGSNPQLYQQLKEKMRG